MYNIITAFKTMKEFKKYYIKTYGCAMNYADSNRIRSILNSCGLQETVLHKDADFILLNSCSVRKQAEDKVSGWGNRNKKRSSERKQKYILTGCMAVRHYNGEKYQEKIKRKFPWIDYVVDIKNIQELPEILELKELFEKKQSYLNIIPEIHGEKTVNIPISTGCNFFCSYCIVPFARGELLHREYEEIMKEVKLQLSRGVKLVCLVAQNVNSWVGMKEGKKISFGELLRDIAGIKGDFWITFVSSNPMDFSDDIVASIRDNKKIMRWINIAVQSGSDEILKKMNRKYTVKEFRDLIVKIRKQIPEIRLTTDAIVGFPTESDGDFEKTRSLIKELKFQMAYVGKYSPRELASSAKLEDDVPFHLKKERENILKDDVNKMRGVLHSDFVGKKIKVLVVGCKKGLSYYYHEVLFEKSLEKEKVGNFVEAYVVDYNLSGLVAKV